MMIVKVPWTAEAEQALQPALLEDTAEIASQVKRGICELWRVDAPGEGYVVTRLESYEAAQPQLCIVGGAGSGYVQTLPGFKEIARRNGAESVRVHTHRKGVCRWLENLGFTESERVYVSKV